MKEKNMQRQLGLIGLFAVLLLLLAACGGSNGNATTSGAVSVQVNETDFKIASSVTSFTPGTAYHFVVTNNGKTAHEFMLLPQSEGSMSGMSMGNMDSMALAKIETINPGETKTVDYTFSSSAASSHPEFACYLPGHYEAGMKLEVTVQS
jgi:uncharacterized cupredoxin-like copper-binding protein